MALHAPPVLGVRPRASAAALLCCLAAAIGSSACEERDPMALAARSPSAVDHAIGPIPGTAPEPEPVRNPLADDAHARAEGRRLFVWMNCSGCHGGHAGGGMGPSLRDETWIYGGDDADIYDSIAAGRANGMPSYGSLLPPESLWQITAYVTTLRTTDEVDPPR